MPATVEFSSTVIAHSMQELLQGKNPCAIPEKGLHKELKRCKKCHDYSGVNVTMQVQCNDQNRSIRMDILDKDMFAIQPDTPPNTSWTMKLLETLDLALSPGVWDKPAFSVGAANAQPVPDVPLVKEIRLGHFDQLFGAEQGVSKIAEQTAHPSLPPSAEIVSMTPAAPISSKLPLYPPIAKAARIEGMVTASFVVNAGGTVKSVAIIDGPRMLHQAVADAIQAWTFPATPSASTGQAAIRFNLNCRNSTP
jgi:TonB family protein